MLLKAPSKIRPTLRISQSRTRSKTPLQQRPSSQTPTIRKKFSPTVNKSLTCYKDQPIAKHSRTSSLDKTRECNSSFKHAKTKSLKSSGKIVLNTREIISLDNVQGEMAVGNYQKAIEMIGKILKNDSGNLEAIYSRGVCFMHLKKYDQAIKDFVQVMDIDPGFDQQLYMALYMSYNSINQPSSALRCLSKGLRKFPNYSQGFFLRGQLYNKSQKYDKALLDFKKVISLDKQQSQVLLHIAESYIGLGETESTLKVLSIAVTRPEILRRALVLRIQVLCDVGRYDDALYDMEKVLKHWPEEASIYYYKGLMHFNSKQNTDAAICFEQVVQANKDPKAVNKALYYLVTIQISERDFYGALHTLERSLDIGQTHELKALHNYTEGVISLMKRKLEEGILIFTGILSSNEKSLKDYIGDCYENRAFASFSLKQYEKALNDFKSAKLYKQVERASEFNIMLCDAIMAEAHQNHITGLEIFKASKELFPKNIMPDLCRACIMLHMSQSVEESSQFINKAEGIIENILAHREPEYEILFYKSILNFFLKKYDKALENAKRTVEKADENIPNHYANRGFCHIALKKYEEAIQDFTIALQLNENFKEVYLYRGISAFLQDDLQLSFDDFSLVAKKFPEDLPLQFKTAKLLMAIGSYNESLEIFNTFFQDSSSIFPAKNYLLLNNFNKALTSLCSIKSTNEVEIDKEVIELIIDIQGNPSTIFESVSICNRLKHSFGKIFTKKYMYWLIGTILLYNNECTAATGYFQAVLEMLHDEEPELFADSITIEEENCEILYNLALCSLKSTSDESKANALMIFEELAEVLSEKHRGQLLFLSAILHVVQRSKGKAEKLFKEAVKADSETLSPFLDGKEISVLPLHTANEFSSIFPMIPIKLEALPTIYVRPAIVLPHADIEYSALDIQKELLGFFSIANIHPRPEAPWLIRVKGSIQFTDAFLEISHDLETEAEEKPSIKIESKAFEIHPGARSQNILRQSSFLSEASKKIVNNRAMFDINLEEKIKNLCND